MRRFPVFPLTWFLATRFTLSPPSQRNAYRIRGQTPREILFCDVPHNIGRSVSACANRYWQPCGSIDRCERGGSIPNRVCELRLWQPGCGAHREKEKQRAGVSWHVSRLSVFTEIPCTLRPITFVTDYSTKVSHRARAETYPDKLHRANRQCSQMELEVRARLFKQRASRACGSHDRAEMSKPVTLNFLPPEGEGKGTRDRFN